ncbi:hypothetical protein WJX72_002660 [[Myrmecia] bisecta]|uniref:Fatty acid desaturase domain-containing protein n=1 Tax=[Myrmecia] bisecta TaxID=41462 RepID=A0AAW1R4I9_9CHLO
MVGLFLIGYFITGCLGITLCYHRLLAHRSFCTPKWLEYTIAYCGALAVQGNPLEWVSVHRWHHTQTDTALDPHSPIEGFWWSHMGWLFAEDIRAVRCGNRDNVKDLSKQRFYRLLDATYTLNVVAHAIAIWWFGGFPALVWGMGVRLTAVYHATWLVNSATHLWGHQPYQTGDLSRNNWWVALIAFGEGWHNNHHAFKFSARHGLLPGQLDATWLLINVLGMLGLAWNIQVPTPAQCEKMRKKLHAA